jgi:hypothetical protein
MSLRPRNALAILLLATALTAVLGCKGKVQTTGPVATPNPTQQARILTDTAEAKYLALMSADLGKLVREQAWFKQLTQAHVDLIAQIMKTERAAKGKGHELVVQDLIKYGTEQTWYSDGLDEAEARGLTGVFEAYEESNANRNAPDITSILPQALQWGTFSAVDLPKGGQMHVVVSAETAEQAQAVLDLAVPALPQIEGMVGAYPYKFLHLMVTDLGEYLAGLSYDQYIIVAPNAIDRNTVVHELTHSTMYGKFPTWFEEGFAYFMGYYMTDDLDAGTKQMKDWLRLVGSDNRLYVGPYKDGSDAGYIAELAQGFMFMKSIYDARGIEGLTAILSKLRTQTLTDQELLREFAQFGTTEEQRAMADYFCKNVVGTARNYCR